MLCLWWNLVKFYPLVPPTLDFFSDFYWDMLGHWINIYNLFYHIVVLKKKLLKIVLLGHYLGKNWASMSHTQNEAKFFFWKQQKKIISFQELFALSKYHTFWLRYEWFSDLCDILLPKPASSGLKQVFSILVR